MYSILINIPNILSSFRLIIAPVLVLIAWQGKSSLFLSVLALSLLSDAFDGFIARRFRITSKIGAKLDSWGDFITYLTVALCAWKLWPEVLQREAFFVAAGISLYMLPIIAGFIKFKRLPCYHTWGAKAQAVLMCIAIYVLLITGIARPFQFAVILQLFVSLEEIAITLWLKERRQNIPSFWHLVHSPT